jgi:hypothetical protein
MQINNGDFVATGPASRARLNFISGGYLQLEENTDPEFWEHLPNAGRCVIEFVLQRGTVSGETGDCDVIATMPDGTEIIIQSKFVLTANLASSVLTILDGQATVRSGRAVQVGTGEQIVISQGFDSRPTPLTIPSLRLVNEYFDNNDFTNPRAMLLPVSVPTLEGTDIQRATQNLSWLGLGLRQVGERSTERISSGAIAEQHPEAGAKVPPGTVVHVFTAISTVPSTPTPAPLTPTPAAPTPTPAPPTPTPAPLTQTQAAPTPTPPAPSKSLFQPGQGLGPNDSPGDRDVLTRSELKVCVRYDQAHMKQSDRAEHAVEETKQAERKIGELDAALAAQEGKIDQTDTEAVERYNNQVDSRDEIVRNLEEVLTPEAQRAIRFQNQLAKQFSSRCAGKSYYENDMQIVRKDLGIVR